jgi:hypothetical protein
MKGLVALEESKKWGPEVLGWVGMTDKDKEKSSALLRRRE